MLSLRQSLLRLVRREPPIEVTTSLVATRKRCGRHKGRPFATLWRGAILEMAAGAPMGPVTLCMPTQSRQTGSGSEFYRRLLEELQDIQHCLSTGGGSSNEAAGGSSSADFPQVRHD